MMQKKLSAILWNAAKNLSASECPQGYLLGREKSGGCNMGNIPCLVHYLIAVSSNKCTFSLDLSEKSGHGQSLWERKRAKPREISW